MASVKPILFLLSVLVGLLLPVNSALTLYTRSSVLTATVSYGGGALILPASLLFTVRGCPLLGRVIGGAHIVGGVVLT